MKILWIVNIVFPEAQSLLNGSGDFKGSGGWLVSYASLLNQRPGIKLCIATASNHVKKLTKFDGENNTYYLFPPQRNYQKYSDYFKIIKQNENPDLVHIHGTEYPYGLAFVEACGNEKVVVSIQGVISEICKYYNSGLSNWEIFKNLTFRDLWGRTLWHDKAVFKRNALLEEKVLQSVNHIIGRTTFDKAHVWAINPKAKYHLCNEALRDEFYSGKWIVEKCRPHTIFVSQAWCPLKGFHMLLRALPLVLREFPDATVSIAGGNLLRKNGFIARLRWQGYYKYISHLMSRFGLTDKIQFLGPLNAEGMKDVLLSSNVFVCPSSIENSSNSLAEAQMLGVPSVVSYVGGLPDMISNDSNCRLYRFDDVEMLAYHITKVFENAGDGSVQQSDARKRHDRKEIADELISIYRDVAEL